MTSPRRQLITGFVQRVMTGPPRLGGICLDVGGGRRGWPLDRTLHSWTVLDVERGPAVDVVGRIEDAHLQFNPGTFDLVKATEVLYLVDNLHEALCAIAYVLRPGGALVITDPFLRPATEASDCRRLTAAGWGRALHSADLSVREIAWLGGRASLQAQLMYESVYACAPLRRLVAGPVAALARQMDQRTEWCLSLGLVARKESP